MSVRLQISIDAKLVHVEAVSETSGEVMAKLTATALDYGVLQRDLMSWLLYASRETLRQTLTTRLASIARAQNACRSEAGLVLTLDVPTVASIIDELARNLTQALGGTLDAIEVM